MTEPEHISTGPLTTTRAEIKKAYRRAPKHQLIDRRDLLPKLTQYIAVSRSRYGKRDPLP